MFSTPVISICALSDSITVDQISHFFHSELHYSKLLYQFRLSMLQIMLDSTDPMIIIRRFFIIIFSHFFQNLQIDLCLQSALSQPSSPPIKYKWLKQLYLTDLMIIIRRKCHFNFFTFFFKTFESICVCRLHDVTPSAQQPTHQIQMAGALARVVGDGGLRDNRLPDGNRKSLRAPSAEQRGDDDATASAVPPRSHAARL